MECEHPHKNIFEFKGLIKQEKGEEFLQGPSENIQSSELGIKQFIPRGASLKNSLNSYVMVVYTGTDTKLALNEGKYRSKISNISYQTNILFAYNVIIMLVMAFIMS